MLKEALQHAIAYANVHELKIAIGIQALHFRPGLSYLEWGDGITDSSAGFAAAAAAPAPAPGPVPPSSTDIVTAVATVVMAAVASTPAHAVMVTSPPAPSTTRLHMLFNQILSRVMFKLGTVTNRTGDSLPL